MAFKHANFYGQSPMRGGRTLEPAYFERIYAADEDPWDFATSRYERDKYAATIAMLKGRRFARAFEIGCSVGVLTALLAAEVDSLLAVDVSTRALEVARRRCAPFANVTVEQMNVPREFPGERFDFVMLSEVGYYWSASDLRIAIDRIAAAAKGGMVELVHYLPKVDDYPLSGDEVHETFLADSRFRSAGAVRADRYRLDLLAVAP
jgi:SAM-dependent methyltransferase